MKKKKFLITWYTNPGNEYAHKHQIICNSKRSANILYNELAKQDETVYIKMEYQQKWIKNID